MRTCGERVAVTLVLGACVDDSIVLAADSKFQVYEIDKTTETCSISSTIDRKLFKVARVGIATYGTSPTGVHVPTVIESARLEPHSNVREVICWLQDRFRDAPEMHALVGGPDEKGTLMLFDVHLGGGRPEQVIDIGAIVLRGVVSVDQPGLGTAAALMSQMLDLLIAKTGIDVGPPYEFLVIFRPE